MTNNNPPTITINGKTFYNVTNITTSGELFSKKEAEHYAKTGRIITSSR